MNTTDTTVKRKKVFRPFINIIKEEKWLQSMADNGWALAEFGWLLYTFTPCTPGEYTVRTSVLGTKEAYEKVSEILKDQGATIIPSSQFQLTQNAYALYALRETQLGEFTINSDNESTIVSLRNNLSIFQPLFIFMAISLTINFMLNGALFIRGDDPADFLPPTLILIHAFPVTMTLVFGYIVFHLKKQIRHYRRESEVHIN